MAPGLLLAEAHAISRKALAKLLELKGYRVTCCADGIEALCALTAERPEVIVLSLDLPRLSGLDLLRAIRGTPWLSDLPVIVLAAMARPDDSRFLASLGVRDYLIRNAFSLHNLLARLDRNASNSGVPEEWRSDASYVAESGVLP